MRIRWNFRDQPSEDFSDKPVFRPKSNYWKPPPGHPGLQLFLCQLEKEILNGLLNDSISIPSIMSKEEWEALRGLADDRSADKGFCMVVWYRDDYIKEANKQLEDNTVYKDFNFKETILSDLVDKSNIIFKETILSDLVDKSNRIFESLSTRKFITEKELKCFSYYFKKNTNLDKSRLHNIPGRSVTPTVELQQRKHIRVS